MKRLIIFLLIAFAGHLQAQTTKTARQPLVSVHPYLDSKTDPGKMDTISLWRYNFDDKKTSNYPDTVHFRGTITFWRTKPVPDTNYEKIFNRPWAPSISFGIYDLADSVYCKQIGLRAKLISSCIPPYVGGDIIVAGNYIFMSEGVCLNCRYSGDADYCHPVVNYVFSSVKTTSNSSLQDILKQFPIKRQSKQE